MRLVYQIIREEYPSCTAKRLPVGCMSIAPVGQATKAEVRARVGDGSIIWALLINCLDQAESRQQLDIGEAKKLSGLCSQFSLFLFSLIL